MSLRTFKSDSQRVVWEESIRCKADAIIRSLNGKPASDGQALRSMLRHHTSVYGQSHLHRFQCTLAVPRIESRQLRNQHEGERKGHRLRISHLGEEEKLSKELSVFTIMKIESCTLCIARLSDDIACVQMNRLEPERLFLNTTGASDFNT
jgi:hypothetical protein